MFSSGELQPVDDRASDASCSASSSGGLASSLLLTLIVLPAIYDLVESRAARKAAAPAA